jgi:hypothetical protein
MFNGMVELVSFFFSFLFNRLNDDLLSLTIAVFRSIWLRKNKMIFEEQFSSPMMVFKEACMFFEVFNMREQLIRAPLVETLNRSIFWKSLDVGFLKVNWDAFLNLNAGIVGLGCVIRNEEGLVVGAKCSACKV